LIVRLKLGTYFARSQRLVQLSSSRKSFATFSFSLFLSSGSSSSVGRYGAAAFGTVVRRRRQRPMSTGLGVVADRLRLSLRLLQELSGTALRARLRPAVSFRRDPTTVVGRSWANRRRQIASRLEHGRHVADMDAGCRQRSRRRAAAVSRGSAPQHRGRAPPTVGHPVAAGRRRHGFERRRDPRRKDDLSTKSFRRPAAVPCLATSRRRRRRRGTSYRTSS